MKIITIFLQTKFWLYGMGMLTYFISLNYGTLAAVVAFFMIFALDYIITSSLRKQKAEKMDEMLTNIMKDIKEHEEREKSIKSRKINIKDTPIEDILKEVEKDLKELQAAEEKESSIKE